MMLAQMPDLTDDDKLRVSGLYDTWTAGSHVEGEICNAEDQTWECFQAHDMYHAGEYAVYNDALYKCVQDTAYNPEDYSPAWEAIT